MALRCTEERRDAMTDTLMASRRRPHEQRLSPNHILGTDATLGCLLRICLRSGAIGDHLKLAVDRAAVLPADTTVQRTDSGGGQDPVSLNSLVMPEIEIML